MSRAEAIPDAIEEAETQFKDGDTKAAFETLTREVRDLNDRVTELEAELEERATVRMPTTDVTDIQVEPEPDGEAPFPLGKALNAKASQSITTELEDRVTAIEQGEADVVVRSETADDALPIENRIARRQAGDGSLTANEERATLVFPKFGSHADPWNGKLQLDSNDVRTILAEQTDKDKEDWNTNTVNRTMRKVAELTSTADEGDWNPKDDDNLISLDNGEKRLTLTADREEWMEFLKEASED